MPDPAGPSETARRVAAYRLGFERLAAPISGDPAADDHLAADVAAGIMVDRSGPMGRYLQARTTFFDRVTVNALSRQVAQIVIVGAGYDGRALRYQAPGVRWWEIDRPRTQGDKCARLARLAIAADHVTFLGLDLADGGVATALVGNGFEPDAPALFLAEGLIPYLDADTLRSVLCELRSLAAPRTRFALSLRRSGADPAERARFDAGVAALGEPAIGSVTAENAEVLLSECRWRPVQLTERARAAGFIMASPVSAPAKSDVPQTVARIGTGSIRGEFITEMFDYDGGREVTVYVPPEPPEALIFAGDGQLISRWGRVLEEADVPSTMIVGVHRLPDETLRLEEYSPGIDPERFAKHERFFVEDVPRWVRTRFGVALPVGRTAVFGVSASGELALAVGLRHPDVYGAILCASPGGGYRPPGLMPSPVPHTYLVAGTLEPFFLENAVRWADTLRDAGADVVVNERPGSHGDAFWQQELPSMVAWAFGRRGRMDDDHRPPLPRDGNIGDRLGRPSDHQDEAPSEIAIRRFDGLALYRALDACRLELGLSWRQLAAQLWHLSFELNDRRNDHPISPSTLTKMATKPRTSCQHALFMLRWLDRNPESFLTGLAHGDDPRFALPRAGPDRRLRWSLKLLSATMDEKRRQEDLTWQQLAELLGCTSSQLTGLRTARFAIGMDLAMRIVQWIGRPAADFIYPAKW